MLIYRLPLQLLSVLALSTPLWAADEEAEVSPWMLEGKLLSIEKNPDIAGDLKQFRVVVKQGKGSQAVSFGDVRVLSAVTKKEGQELAVDDEAQAAANQAIALPPAPAAPASTESYVAPEINVELLPSFNFVIEPPAEKRDSKLDEIRGEVTLTYPMLEYHGILAGFTKRRDAVERLYQVPSMEDAHIYIRSIEPEIYERVAGYDDNRKPITQKIVRHYNLDFFCNQAFAERVVQAVVIDRKQRPLVHLTESDQNPFSELDGVITLPTNAEAIYFIFGTDMTTMTMPFVIEKPNLSKLLGESIQFSILQGVIGAQLVNEKGRKSAFPDSKTGKGALKGRRMAESQIEDM